MYKQNSQTLIKSIPDKLIYLKVVFLILSCFFQTLKVATNETHTLHYTICTWIALVIYDNNDQQFNSTLFLIAVLNIVSNSLRKKVTVLVFIFFSEVPNRSKSRHNACLKDIVFIFFSTVPNISNTVSMHA